MIGRFGKIILIIGILALLVLADSAIYFWVDWQWFQELGYTILFWKGLLAKGMLFVITGLAFFALLAVNILIARRLSSRSAPVYAFGEFEIPQLAMVKRLLSGGAWVIALVFSLMIAQWGASQWSSLLQFQNALPFGAVDPLFGLDIGFYLFSLPFYTFLFQFLFLSLLLALALSAAIHFFSGGIWLTGRGLQLSAAARWHLSTLAAIILAWYSFHYRLKMFDLLYSERGILFGAGYTDIKVELPALWMLAGCCWLAAALMLWGALKKSFKPALAGLVILLATSILGRGIIPGVIQRFEVAPNEINKESPYIKHSIHFTRQAFGIDQIEEKEFPAIENLTVDSLKRNELTLQNIRLWDHRPLLRTFSQLQVIRPYYDFVDVDNDRYQINGQYRQISLSPRELSSEKLPSRIWINEHLIFTHGYGLCLSPVNQISSEGLPAFMIKDIPPAASTDLKVARPQIYFGEISKSYCFVKTAEREFDYPSGTENVTTLYQGSGGIPVNYFWRKLLMAWRFKEQNIVLSTAITGESRLLFDRDIQGRVQKLMPFLEFDHDPYLVISNSGNLFWMLDAYTTSNRFPYSHPVNDNINYIRNSVKITIDAYNGTVRFYLNDPSDPVIQVYNRIFPGVFEPLEAMPEDLRKHVRYPEDLFTIQAQTYATFHMRDPQVFYNKEDLWRIPAITKESDQSTGVEPYYTIMKLGTLSEREEFLLMTPFTPSNRENMIAWMAARCDAPNYGKLVVYNFPKQRLVFGPTQIASRMNQDTEISQQLSLWNQKGSSVIYGSLLVIPIEQSILYVQPLYLAAEQTGSLPELKRIIVAYGDKIAMEESLEGSLRKIFGDRAASQATAAAATSPTAAAGPSLAPLASMQNLIKRAADQYERAQQALRQGNWAGYGEEIRQLGETLKELKGKK